MEELGRYHADTVYNLGGTGILIKYHQKFFLLTAQHVLDAHYEIAQNESPFFTHLFSNRGWIGAEDLGFPMRGWRIGELIKADMPNIDMQDIVLVELASLFRFPNTFIDLDSPNAPKGVPVRNLSKGMLLIASGYPIDENPIEYPYGDDYNCSTVINKHITYGGRGRIRCKRPELSQALQRGVTTLDPFPFDDRPKSIQKTASRFNACPRFRFHAENTRQLRIAKRTYALGGFHRLALHVGVVPARIDMPSP